MKNLDCIVSTPYIQKWNGGSFAHSHLEVFWHLIIHQTTWNLERNLGVFCFRAVMYQGWRSSLAMKMGWVRFSHGPQFCDSSSIGRAPSFQVGGLQVRVLSIAQLIVLWHFKKKLLSSRLTAGQLPLKEFIEVRILGGQLKNFFLKKFGKWKTLSYLCIVIEGKGGRVSSLTLWKPKKWTESWDSAFNSQVAELVDAGVRKTPRKMQRELWPSHTGSNPVLTAKSNSNK